MFKLGHCFTLNAIMQNFDGDVAHQPVQNEDYGDEGDDDENKVRVGGIRTCFRLRLVGYVTNCRRET